MMKKTLLMIVLALSATGCTLSPPPPPQCVDDGRGMVPLNPEMLTQEQIKAVKAKYQETTWKDERTKGAR
ncbi:hypothetical protein ABSP62_004508 [Salmonella enterica subsp. enterica serovar Typhimurium]